MVVEFHRTGNIGPITLGMTRDELVAHLGEPDAVSAESRSRRWPAILKYGELEFHFGREKDSPLWLIYQDTDAGVVVTSITG